MNVLLRGHSTFHNLWVGEWWEWDVKKQVLIPVNNLHVTVCRTNLVRMPIIVEQTLVGPIFTQLESTLSQNQMA